MSVRANWHVDELLADADQDPFSEVRIEDVGKPIDLQTDEPRLVARITELVALESDLREQGVRCPIRDSPVSNCSACPVAQPPDSRFGRLCAVGMEMDRLLTTRVVLQEAPGAVPAAS